jgi:hypothetical protein
MNAYSELVLSNFEWLYAKPGGMLALLAAAPLFWFIVQFRILSLIAAGLIAGGIVLLRSGVEELTVSVLAISLSSLLVAIDAGLTRRRLVRLESSLGAMAQAVRALEVAEERWQGYIARQQATSPAAKSLDGKRQVSEGTLAGEPASQLAIYAQASDVINQLPDLPPSPAQQAEPRRES